MSTIYILGAGAVGQALAAHLIRAGREAVLVRFRENGSSSCHLPIRVISGDEQFEVEADRIPFRDLSLCGGDVLVVATKATCNEAIAARFSEGAFEDPVVLLQNGVGVEKPFLGKVPTLLRGVLYVTAECQKEHTFPLGQSDRLQWGSCKETFQSCMKRWLLFPPLGSPSTWIMGSSGKSGGKRWSTLRSIRSVHSWRQITDSFIETRRR